jgi:hypothetical protein
MVWKSHISLSEDAETCFLPSKDESSLNFKKRQCSMLMECLSVDTNFNPPLLDSIFKYTLSCNFMLLHLALKQPLGGPTTSIFLIISRDNGKISKEMSLLYFNLSVLCQFEAK